MLSVELFAGAGGLALGCAGAGFGHEALLELDASACRVLSANASWTVVPGDVRLYDFSKHQGRVDVVTGGPPCQPFSLGGRHLGSGDARDMFPEAVRAVREVRPKAFLFENVRGLLRETFADYFSYVLHRLRYPHAGRGKSQTWMDHLADLRGRHLRGGASDLDSEYRVAHRLLNAADYGVPQRRQRVFIVGVRADLGFDYRFPDPTHEQDALLHAKWVTGEYWARHGVRGRDVTDTPASDSARVRSLRFTPPPALLEPWVTVRDCLVDLPAPPGGRDFHDHEHHPGAREYPGHTGSDIDSPAKALKAGVHGVPGGENMLRFAGGGFRYFTVREAARLQTFPDSWRFGGAWAEGLRLVGNAVPVKLAEVVAVPLAASLMS